MDGYNNLYPESSFTTSSYGGGGGGGGGGDPFTSGEAGGDQGGGGDVYYDANMVSPDQSNRTDILKLILYDLNSAIAPRDIRLMAIHSALEEFDHDDEILHDEELELRADHILLQKLTYAMCIDPHSIEVGYICSAMEAVYRAGRNRLAQSFHEICDALLPLFCEMIRPPSGYIPAWSVVQGEQSSKQGSIEGGVGITNNNIIQESFTTAGTGRSTKHSGSGMDPQDEFNTNYMLAPPTMNQPQQPHFVSQMTQDTAYNYGDFDEESAESVEIPSGTGEYFEQMRGMNHTGGAGGAAGPGDHGEEEARQEQFNIPPVDRSESSAGAHIPGAAGDYFEEMKRRSSAEDKPPNLGGNTFNPAPVGGTTQGEHQQADSTNMLVPGQPGLENMGEGALVLRTGDFVPNNVTANTAGAGGGVGHQWPAALSPSPEPHANVSIGIGQGQGQGQVHQAQAEGQGSPSNDTIRAELEDAKQAMKKAQAPPTAGPMMGGQRLSIESDMSPQVRLPGQPNRLSIESDATPPLPVFHKPPHPRNTKRLSIESMATTQQVHNTAPTSPRMHMKSRNPLVNRRLTTDSFATTQQMDNTETFAQQQERSQQGGRPFRLSVKKELEGEEEEEEDGPMGLRGGGLDDSHNEAEEEESVMPNFAAYQSEFNDRTGGGEGGGDNEAEEEVDMPNFSSFQSEFNDRTGGGEGGGDNEADEEVDMPNFSSFQSEFNDRTGGEGGGSGNGEDEEVDMPNFSSFQSEFNERTGGEGGGSGNGEDEDDMPKSSTFQSEFNDRTGGGGGVGGEGLDDSQAEGKYNEDDHGNANDNEVPIFSASAYQPEFKNLVSETGSAGGGGSEVGYEESQDNPFSDTSSFYGGQPEKPSFRDFGGGNSSVGGGSSFKDYGGASASGSGVAYSESAYSEHQPNGANPGSDVAGSYVGSVGGPYSEQDGEDNMSTHNPFSDTASFSSFGQSGAGGSSVFGGSVFSSGRSRFTERDGIDQHRFPPKIDEYSESGGSNVDLDHGGGDSAPGSVPQGMPEFDEHGGYSGAAPAVFGFDNSNSDRVGEEEGSESKAGDHSSASYDRSGGASSYNDRSGPSSGYQDQGSGPHSEGGLEQESEYSSVAQGYEGGVNRHNKLHYSEMSQGGGFNDDPEMRRQSDVTDEWGDQDDMGGSMMGQSHGGVGGGYGEETNIDDMMYNMSQTTGMGNFGMSELEENLPPLSHQHQPNTSEVYPPEQMPTGQFQIDDEEEKYQDYPFEGGDNTVPQSRGGIMMGQDEDIFQFQEPMVSTTSQDYFNYSDPVEGEICPLAVRKVLKILRYFSRVLSAMEPLAQHTGLVDALLYHMTKKPLSVDYDDEISSRVDAIAVVVNLACAEENKIMLVYHPGLLDAIINIANHDPIDEAREHAAIVLMNLAYAEENKVHMVNQDHLLDTLVHLLSDVSPFTRRYASAALFTLACTYANTAVMARHCDGGILEALRKVLLNDPIDEARVNAAEALFNMARNNSDDTVENMGNHPRLLASLSHSVLTDYSADVRAYSARALEWLSADIHHPMPCHRILLKALTTASQWTKTTCIAEALKMQASLSENRKPMVEHPGLLDALATLSLLDGITDDEVKTCAISAIERLSKEASTRHIMVKNEGVMTALTKATFAKDGAEDDVPDEGTPTALLMKTALKNLSAHL